jgi:hypothetical protein
MQLHLLYEMAKKIHGSRGGKPPPLLNRTAYCSKKRRVPDLLAIYSRLINKRSIVIKTEKNEGEKSNNSKILTIFVMLVFV